MKMNTMIFKLLPLAFLCGVMPFSFAGEKTFEAPRWKAADFPSPVVVPGSALDFSKIKTRYPVAENVFLHSDGRGNAYFENAPSKPVRLLGSNGVNLDVAVLLKLPEDQWKSCIDRTAKQFQVQGYDYVRTNCFMDTGPFIDTVEPQTPNPKALEIVDYYLYVIRQHELHVYCTLVSYQFGFPVWKEGFGQRTDSKCRTFYGESEALARWDKTVLNLLNHVNPYTGIAWKDDPVFMFFELYNEQEICLYEVFIANRISAKGRNFILNGFKEFLKRKYGTSEALSAAWGREIIDFEHGLGVGNFPKGVAEDDWEEYTVECGEKSYRHCENTIRSTGSKIPITNFNFQRSMNFSRIREKTVDLVAMNSYFNHPSKWMRKGSVVAQNSSVKGLAGYWRSLASTRLFGRPMFVGEYNHCYWNPYVYEAGLLFPAYSALQGFSGLTAHCNPVRETITETPSGFDLGALPTMRANEVLAMLLFGRGDVAPSPHQVKFILPPDEGGAAGERCVNMQQSLLSLICGFSVSVSKPSRSEGNADMVVVGTQGTDINNFDWSATVDDSDKSTDLICDAVKVLKQRGILSDGNLTNPEQLLYQSDTGEITIDGKTGRIMVKTALTEGTIVSPDVKNQRIGIMTVCSTTTPGVAALSSLDGKTLDNSSHMLFIFNTMSAATGLKLSEDGTTLIDAGTLPVQMETGVITCRLNRAFGKEVKLYPLSLNGIRREPLSVDVLANGCTFSIDTTKLPNGTTPYFELVIE